MKVFKPQPSSNVGWMPREVVEYKDMLSVIVEDLVFKDPFAWKSRDIDAKLWKLESLIGQTALICNSVERRVDASKQACDENTKKIMQRRREMEPGSSKMIQKEIKNKRKAKKREQIVAGLLDF